MKHCSARPWCSQLSCPCALIANPIPFCRGSQVIDGMVPHAASAQQTLSARLMYHHPRNFPRKVIIFWVQHAGKSDGASLLLQDSVH